MTTVTLVKPSSYFIYDDYLRGRAALRVKELSSANPVQSIHRAKNHAPIDAVLVSAAWYDAKLVTFAGASTFKTEFDNVSDDYVGVNLSTMINLILGRSETTALTKKTALEGLSLNHFKGYSIVATKEYYADGNDAVPFDSKFGGDIKAYLLHPAFYASLLQAPVAIVYAGAGNGTLASALTLNAVAETITITATSATSFTVVGSVSGALGVATVGELFKSSQIEVLLTAGTVLFGAGDAFTVTSFAPVL